MSFDIPIFTYPDFSEDRFKNMKNIGFKKVEKDGVAPDDYYLTNHYPTLYKYEEKWILPKYNSLNCVAVLEEGDILIKELRDLKVGDRVVVGRTNDGSQGILTYKEGFPKEVYYKPGGAVESSFSKSYDNLFKLMDYEKKNGGYIVWIMGPSVVFDYDTRNALVEMARAGYINCVIGGNAIATHDLEGGFLGTSLGQNIYTQENMPHGHYNHLDLLNEVRMSGSIEKFISQDEVKDGLIKTLVEEKIPFTLAGSIRDDGPLPEVFSNIDEALTDVKKHLDKATLIIGLATLLHNVSTANLASTYRFRDSGEITPVYMYGVDITENVANKIAAARENIGFVPIITNVQDFVVNCKKNLIEDKKGGSI